MSLSTAALGWGEYLRRNNQFINLDFLCPIYMGVTLDELNKSLSCYSKMALTPRQDEKNSRKINYYNSNGDVMFAVTVQSNSVCRIWYKGLLNHVFDGMIYCVGKKKFFTNTRIDGYMIAIKSEDEIYLKEDNAVQANDINSKELGVVVEHLTKKSAQARSEAWAGVHSSTKDVYNQSLYQQSAFDVKQLEKQYIELSNKAQQIYAQIQSIKKLLDRSDNLIVLQNKQKELKNKAQGYRNEYDNAKKKVQADIDRLIGLGKLYYSGEKVCLNKDSNKSTKVRKTRQKPIYDYVYEESYPEMLCHEDYDQYESRSRRGRSVICTGKKIVGYNEEVYYEGEEDKDFNRASGIVEYLNKYWDNCNFMNEKLNAIKNDIEIEEQKIKGFMQTSDYINGETMVDKLQLEYNALQSQLSQLKIQLYGNC